MSFNTSPEKEHRSPIATEECRDERFTTNYASPNSRDRSAHTTPSPPPRISTCSSMMGESDDTSPDSYTSYSSIGVNESESNHTNDNNSAARRRILRSNTYQSVSSKRGSDHKSKDSENVIGHGLLSEVLKMQGLLEQYQHSLTALEIEKLDNQQEINKLDKQLRGKGETEERYKEEIWNLELQVQDLDQKMNDYKQYAARANLEQTRMFKEQTVLTQELEQLKSVQHTWELNLKSSTEQHEEEVMMLKKNLHLMRQEKDALSKQLQETIASLVPLRHSIMSGVELKSDTIEDQQAKTEPKTTLTTETSGGSNKETIGRKTNNAVSEAEVQSLKASLDHAHEIIQSMQGKIDKERNERVEIDVLLREAQETIENYKSTSQWFGMHGAASPTLSISTCTSNNSSSHNNSNVDGILSPTTPSNNRFLISSSNNLAHNALSPTAPRSRHASSNRHPQSKRSSSVRGNSICRKRKSKLSIQHGASGGKTLSDELSLAGSMNNFMSNSMADFVTLSTNESTERDNNASLGPRIDTTAILDNKFLLSPTVISNSPASPRLIITKDDGVISTESILQPSDPSKQRKLFTHNNDLHQKFPTVELSCQCQKSHSVIIESQKTEITSKKKYEFQTSVLPSFSNHDILLALSPSSPKSLMSGSLLSNHNNGEQQETYGAVLDNVNLQQQQPNYGSLLVEPRSYIYESRKEQLEKMKQALASKNSSAITPENLKAILSMEGDQKSLRSNSTASMGVLSQFNDNNEQESQVVDALARTMIGDWMFKYVRKAVGSGISEKRHERFFWIHPYTQTLYWSAKEPGSNRSQVNTKSVLVKSFSVLENSDNSSIIKNEKNDSNQLPPSISVITPSRSLKIQCLDMVSFEAWIKSLNYLLMNGEEKNKKVAFSAAPISDTGSVRKVNSSRMSRSSTALKSVEENNSFVMLSTVLKRTHSTATNRPSTVSRGGTINKRQELVQRDLLPRISFISNNMNDNSTLINLEK